MSDIADKAEDDSHNPDLMIAEGPRDGFTLNRDAGLLSVPVIAVAMKGAEERFSLSVRR